MSNTPRTDALVDEQAAMRLTGGLKLARDLQEMTSLARHIEAAFHELVIVSEAASHALRSYQYGNASPDLAQDVAAALDEALAKAQGHAAAREEKR